MKYPLDVPFQVTYRGLDPSRSITYLLQKRVAWLAHFSRQLMSCRILVEAPPYLHQGNLFSVRIHLQLAGAVVDVSRRSPLHSADKDVHVCIREAFDEARRELEDYERRRRRDIKSSERKSHGIIIQLVEDDGGYGFIRDEQGREFFFHAHSVLGEKYSRLQVGTEVKFSEKQGNEGPQATSVDLVGKQWRHFPENFRKTA